MNTYVRFHWNTELEMQEVVNFVLECWVLFYKEKPSQETLMVDIHNPLVMMDSEGVTFDSVDALDNTAEEFGFSGNYTVTHY